MIKSIAKQLLESALFSFLTTHCFKHFLLVCIRYWSTREGLENSTITTTIFFENIIRSYFQRNWPNWKTEFILRTEKEEIDCFSRDVICIRCNTVFEVMGGNVISVPIRQLTLLFMTQKPRREPRKGNKTKCIDITCHKKIIKLMRRRSLSDWVYSILLYQCINQKSTSNHFPYNHLLNKVRLMQGISNGKLFWEVEFDIEVLNISERSFFKFFSNIQKTYSIRKIRILPWNNMMKKIKLRTVPAKCFYMVFTQQIEGSSPLYLCFTWNFKCCP